MKKLFFALFTFLTLSTLCFGISNITLYKIDKEFAKIINNTIYEGDDTLIGNIIDGKILIDDDEDYTYTITEDQNYIYINSTDNETNEIVYEYKFSKKTCYLIYSKEEDDIETFYEDSGLLKSGKYYHYDGSFFYSIEYIYDNKHNKIQQVHFDENNNILYSYKFFYDDTNKLTFDEEYDPSGKISKRITYSKNTAREIKEQIYNEQEIIQKEIIYNEYTGDEIERHLLNKTTNKLETWKFLKFNDNDKYLLQDGYYLCKDLFYYDIYKKRDGQEETVTPLKYRTIKKCNFDKSCPGYSYLINLLNSNQLFNSNVKFCNDKDEIYYYFTYDENNMLDLSSCYEVKTIKKQIDYLTLNKSGKGSGPFGFDIGMTLEEIRKACDGREPEYISDDRYYVKPIKAHPDFEKYIVWVSQKYGLYYIKAIGKEIKTSNDGNEIKTQFNKIVPLIEKRYGKAFISDTVNYLYEYKDNEHWLQSLQDEKRVLRANWYVSNDKIDSFDGIGSIYLGVSAHSYYDYTYLWLEYNFLNSNDAEELLNDVF